MLMLLLYVIYFSVIYCAAAICNLLFCYLLCAAAIVLLLLCWAAATNKSACFQLFTFLFVCNFKSKPNLRMRLLCGWRIERERRGERRRLMCYSTRSATVPRILFMARAARERESRPRGVCPRPGKREGFPS